MNKMNISCSALIKQSCAQLWYLREKKRNLPITQAQIKGNIIAEKKSISEYKEMRGCYEYKNYLLFYTFDEIRLNKDYFSLIEHKNGDFMYDWFIRQSIIQLAFYISLLKLNPSKKYYTAKFFRKQGYNTNYLDVLELKNSKNILICNDITYKISVINPQKILDFYLEKLEKSFSYKAAKAFDIDYKRKEWKHLRKYISYKKL